MKMQGPIEVELKVHITDGEVSGEATIGCGRGKYPTAEEVRARVKRFADEQMPEGFRLMTKREYWDAICAREYGDRFAMPGDEDFEP